MLRLYKLLELIILGVTFFGLVAPVSILLRLMGRDLLNQKLTYKQKSYWVEHSQPKLVPKNFYTQFISK